MNDRWHDYALTTLAQLLAEGLHQKPADVARVAALIADAMAQEYLNRF